MQNIRYRFVVVSALSLGVIHFSGCGASGLPDSGEGLESWQAALTTSERFESGSKGAYAAGNVTLGSGVWNMNDALIGNLSSDVKNGAQAARVRNIRRSGHHAIRSHDRSRNGLHQTCDLRLGLERLVGALLVTGPRELLEPSGIVDHHEPQRPSHATFNVNRAGTIRFDLRKLDGGSNRVDFDDISITDSSGGISDGGTNPPAPA